MVVGTNRRVLARTPDSIVLVARCTPGVFCCHTDGICKCRFLDKQTVLPTVRFSPATTVEFIAAANKRSVISFWTLYGWRQAPS
jgi:hypothetical protein